VCNRKDKHSRLAWVFLLRRGLKTGLVFINLASIHLTSWIYAATTRSNFTSLLYYAFAATSHNMLLLSANYITTSSPKYIIIIGSAISGTQSYLRHLNLTRVSIRRTNTEGGKGENRSCSALRILNVVLSFEWLSGGSSSIEDDNTSINLASWNHRPEIAGASSLADSAGSRRVITVCERRGFNQDPNERGLKGTEPISAEFKIEYQPSLYLSSDDRSAREADRLAR